MDPRKKLPAKITAKGSVEKTSGVPAKCRWCEFPLKDSPRLTRDQDGLVYHSECWEKMQRWLRLTGLA